MIDYRNRSQIVQWGRPLYCKKHERETEEEAEFLHPSDIIANPDKALSKPNGIGTMF